jgi:glycopeptide antibiotics resistance protein
VVASGLVRPPEMKTVKDHATRIPAPVSLTPMWTTFRNQGMRLRFRRLVAESLALETGAPARLSRVAATEAPAPGPARWRRPAWLTAALVIPIVAMQFWARPSAVYAAPGGHKITNVVLAHFVVPNESPVMNAAFLAQVQRTGLCAWHLEFCKYRGLYRQVGFPFLILSAIALPCWLVFRLYRRRTRGHPLSARREILLLTVVVYLLCLATLTLTPNGSSRLRAEATAGIELHPNLASLTCSSALMPRAPNARAFCVQNAAGNVLLFFPLGILLPLVWRHLRFWRGIQIAIALSFSVELLQYLSSAWGSYRTVDINDVILNALGACLGLVLVYLLRLRQGTRPAVPPA